METRSVATTVASTSVSTSVLLPQKKEQADTASLVASSGTSLTTPLGASLTPLYPLETPWQLWVFPKTGNWDSGYRDLKKSSCSKP